MLSQALPRLIKAAKVATWRIMLALIVAWSTLFMMTPTFASEPTVKVSTHHQAIAADAHCESMCATGLVHGMTGGGHQGCVVCPICSSLAVSAAPDRSASKDDSVKSIAMLALAGLSRSPDHRPPILSLFAT